MPNATNSDKRSDWAEDLSDLGPDTQIYEGEASRAALAELLGGHPAADGQDVTRRLRGRPSLSPSAGRGTSSRQLHVRIGEPLSSLVDLYIDSSAIRNESELVRLALSEYFDRHHASA